MAALLVASALVVSVIGIALLILDERPGAEGALVGGFVVATMAVSANFSPFWIVVAVLLIIAGVVVDHYDTLTQTISRLIGWLGWSYGVLTLLVHWDSLWNFLGQTGSIPNWVILLFILLAGTAGSVGGVALWSYLSQKGNVNSDS